MQNSKLQFKIKKFSKKTTITFNFKLLTLNFWRSQTGQTLMELVVVVAVSAIVVGALVFATIASLRNASFSKNQAQATKLAQEGIERVRSGRDRNSAIINFTLQGRPVSNWQDPNLWYQIADGCCSFKIKSNAELEFTAQAETIGVFQRIVILSDDAAFATQKTVTVIVSWTDFSGSHKSELTTILRKL